MQSKRILYFLGFITSFTIILLIVFIFISANFDLVRNFQAAPPNTKYFGAVGFFFDYYQFLSWMRDGQQGKILLSSRYIPDSESGVLLHPLFPLIGFIGSFIHARADITYHVVRNLSLAGWLISLYLFVRILFSDKYIKRVAYVAILISGGFPIIAKVASTISLLPFIDFWKTFYPLEKFIIPPHHLLANTIFILLILCLSVWVEKKKETLAIYPVLIIMSVALMLINPASMTFLILVLSVIFVLSLISLLFKIGERKENIRFIKYYLIIILSVVPLYLYNLKIFTYGNPWKYFYLGEKNGRYMVSYFQYIASLGPFLLTSLLSVFYIKKFKIREKILFVWVILPLIMFPFVGRQLPFSMSRLFAQNLFIPTVLLTVFFLIHLRKMNTVSRIFKSIIILFLFITTISGIIYSFSDVFWSYQYHNYYNVFIPDNLSQAMKYINNHTRKNSTVIAGENISNIIPAFTDNTVVLGRLDAYQDYGSIKQQVDQIYLRRISDEKIMERLNDWKVQYIVFGLDQLSYQEFIKKGSIDRIKKVFESGEIILAEVM